MATAIAVVGGYLYTAGAAAIAYAGSAVGAATIAGVSSVASIASSQYTAHMERGAARDASDKAAQIAAKQRNVVDKTRPDLRTPDIDPLTGKERDKRDKKSTAKSRFKVDPITSGESGVQLDGTSETAPKTAGVQI